MLIEISNRLNAWIWCNILLSLFYFIKQNKICTKDSYGLKYVPQETPSSSNQRVHWILTYSTYVICSGHKCCQVLSHSLCHVHFDSRTLCKVSPWTFISMHFQSVSVSNHTNVECFLRYAQRLCCGGPTVLFILRFGIFLKSILWRCSAVFTENSERSAPMNWIINLIKASPTNVGSEKFGMAFV